uniref:hypothetical protein n=1 Tax=Algoriphagus sp. TaxID=1872435 RepID=UPI004047FA3B
MEIIIGLIIGGIIYWFFIRPNERKKNQSMTDIINNDPVIKEINNDLEAIGIEHSKKKFAQLERDKSSYIKKVQNFYKLGYLTEKQRDAGLVKFKEVFNKKYKSLKLNPNKTIEGTFYDFFSSIERELEKIRKVHQLTSIYGEEIAKKLAYNHEVWIGMTRAELEISRGRPSDIEKEMTQNGEIEKYVYGNKNTGSYFTINKDKVTKIKDRDDYSRLPGRIEKISRGVERMFE